MAKISVVINTYNEEAHIVRCLKSVTWADEIVLVDMHSEDKTRELAKKFTKHIYLHEKTGYVEPARNFAIAKATGDWILIVDADEEIPESLAKQLQSLTSHDASVVAIPRKNILFGKWIEHTGWWPDRQIRFFKKGSVTWKNEIHSTPETKGKVMQLEGEQYAIVHHNYQSIKQFLYKSYEVYAAQEAETLINKGYKFTYMDAIRFPLQEFLSRYFAREGYKDGFHGLMLSVLMGIYHFVIFAYIWEKKKFVSEHVPMASLEKEVQKASKELLFWTQTKTIEQEKDFLKKVALRLQRKIRV